MHVSSTAGGTITTNYGDRGVVVRHQMHQSTPPRLMRRQPGKGSQFARTGHPSGHWSNRAARPVVPKRLSDIVLSGRPLPAIAALHQETSVVFRDRHPQYPVAHGPTHPFQMSTNRHKRAALAGGWPI